MVTINASYYSPLGIVEFELDNVEQLVLASLAESSYGMHQGFDSGHFKETTLNKIFLKFKDLGILREYNNRYYLPPQMYIIAERMSGASEIRGYAFIKCFEQFVGDGLVDFTDFSQSDYYLAIFNEYFTPQFNNEVQQFSVDHNSSERHIEKKTTNSEFKKVFEKEIQSLNEGITFEVIN